MVSSISRIAVRVFLALRFCVVRSFILRIVILRLMRFLVIRLRWKVRKVKRCTVVCRMLRLIRRLAVRISLRLILVFIILLRRWSAVSLLVLLTLARVNCICMTLRRLLKF